MLLPRPTPPLQDWYLGAWVLCVLSFDLPLGTDWSTALSSSKHPVNGYRPDHATAASLLRRWHKLIEALQVRAACQAGSSSDSGAPRCSASGCGDGDREGRKAEGSKGQAGLGAFERAAPPWRLLPRAGSPQPSSRRLCSLRPAQEPDVPMRVSGAGRQTLELCAELLRASLWEGKFKVRWDSTLGPDLTSGNS